MAKATFEKRDPNEGSKDFMILDDRRMGPTTRRSPVHEEKYPGLKGGPTVVRGFKETKVKGTPVPLSGPDRKLFSEDLSHTEIGRLEKKHTEWQSSGQARHTKLKGEVDQKAGKEMRPTSPRPTALTPKAVDAGISVRPTGETYADTSKRVLQSLASDSPHVRLPGEPSVPGAGWYFHQNRAYREGAGSPDPNHINRTIIGGSAMSPLNAPDMELASALEIASKHLDPEGGKFSVSKQLAGYVNRKEKGEVIQPGEQHIADATPEAIRGMASADRRERFPQADRKSNVQWREASKGGVNLINGVKGIRGEALEVLSPPLSAPKVNTYTHNNLDYHANSPEQESRYVGLVEQAAGGKAPKVDKRVRLTDQDADHVLSRMGQGTPSYNPNDRAVRQVNMNRGRLVDMDNLHPAAVEALSDSRTRSANPKVQEAALASANHPIVADSWMNAEVEGQPQASVRTDKHIAAGDKAAASGKQVRGPMNPASVYKTAGSKYWNSKSLDDGSNILDVSTGGNARLEAATLHHASVDHVIRQAAHRAPEVLGTDTTMPSVGVQESSWSVSRRISGKDTDYNKAQRRLLSEGQFK